MIEQRWLITTYDITLENGDTIRQITQKVLQYRQQVSTGLAKGDWRWSEWIEVPEVYDEDE